MKIHTRAFTLLLLATALPVQAQWSTATVPQIRSEFTATTTETKLYIAGGTFQAQALDSVDVLDIASGTWTQLQLSTPRLELASASVGHEVFFGGGEPSVHPSATPVDTVDVYNELTDSWSIERLPVAVSLVGAGSFGTKVYFSGGFTPGPGVLPVLQIFDTVSRTWELLRTPGPGRGRGLVLADERWLCAGMGGGISPAAELIDIYDSWSGTWTQIVAPDAMLSMALSEGRLKMTSCSNGLPEHVLYEYDLAVGNWSIRRRPSDRCASFSGSIGPFTVLANGFFPGNVIYPDAEVHNRLTDQWETTLLSVQARARVVTVHEHSGSVFIIGGQTTPDSSSSIDNIDIFRVDHSMGSSYCAPAASNSSGSPALIEAAGLLSTAENWFFLGLNGGPPDQVAMFLIGSQAATATMPGGSQGNLCLGGTIGRLSSTVGVIRADGSYGSQVDLGLPDLPMHSIGIGETWYFQAWFRDANPGPTTNFTDALSVTFE